MAIVAPTGSILEPAFSAASASTSDASEPASTAATELIHEPAFSAASPSTSSVPESTHLAETKSSPAAPKRAFSEATASAPAGLKPASTVALVSAPALPVACPLAGQVLRVVKRQAVIVSTRALPVTSTPKLSVFALSCPTSTTSTTAVAEPALPAATASSASTLAVLEPDFPVATAACLKTRAQQASKCHIAKHQVTNTPKAPDRTKNECVTVRKRAARSRPMLEWFANASPAQLAAVAKASRAEPHGNAYRRAAGVAPACHAEVAAPASPVATTSALALPSCLVEKNALPTDDPTPTHVEPVDNVVSALTVPAKAFVSEAVQPCRTAKSAAHVTPIAVPDATFVQCAGSPTGLACSEKPKHTVQLEAIPKRRIARRRGKTQGLTAKGREPANGIAPGQPDVTAVGVVSSQAIATAVEVAPAKNQAAAYSIAPAQVVASDMTTSAPTITPLATCAVSSAAAIAVTSAVALAAAPAVASASAPPIALTGTPDVALAGAPAVAPTGAPAVAPTGAPVVALTGAPAVALAVAPAVIVPAHPIGLAVAALPAPVAAGAMAAVTTQAGAGRAGRSSRHRHLTLAATNCLTTLQTHVIDPVRTLHDTIEDYASTVRGQVFTAIPVLGWAWCIWGVVDIVGGYWGWLETAQTGWSYLASYL
eukprot:TRINITY_DN869_c0_g1_i8.p1 TRINITY_DN869_c0_g1~~TRINITY_DN869_c0_g1_i8.p1  ORF type:complete len:655 (+),score=64.66 TRINITY_DN869_c0_g1_i8:900-2864(+)